MDSDESDRDCDSTSSDTSSNSPVDQNEDFTNMKRNIRNSNNLQHPRERAELNDDDELDEKENTTDGPKSSPAILSPFSSVDENEDMSQQSFLDDKYQQCEGGSNRSGSGSRNSNKDEESNNFQESISSSNKSSSDDEEDDDDDDDDDEVQQTVNREGGCLQGEKEFNLRSEGPSSALDEMDAQENRDGKSTPSSRRSSISSTSNDDGEGYYNTSMEEHHCQLGEELNIAHEDLSDVSDVDMGKNDHNLSNSNETEQSKEEQLAPTITDLRQKLNKKKNLQTTHQGDDTVDGVNILGSVAKSSNNDGEEKVNNSMSDYGKTHDEDALDFEAEDGECSDANKNDTKTNVVVKEEEELDENIEQHLEQSNKTQEKQEEVKKSGDDEELEDGEELEEGEVTDEDEKRPEETEPKPVCRFYTRGQCTWGMSCRFLHPGVTDKGNYTMFDMVRPLPLLGGGGGGGGPTAAPRSSGYPPSLHGIPADYHDYRTDRLGLHHRGLPPPLHHPSSIVYGGHHDVRPPVGLESGSTGPVIENAWERGLRTAKEMMRKANKRKEQDIDFDDKKMNLTLSPDELDKDPYYLKDRLSPESMHHPIYPESSGGLYNSPVRYGRGLPPPSSHYDEVDLYGRSTRYRELPPHRMPQYEDEKRVRPAREVIVQRVESTSRGDEWNDPWMRSRSPGSGGVASGVGGGVLSRDASDKRRRDRRSYSSNSSYSSSSSSQSDSSSENSSRSISTSGSRRRRFNTAPHKSPSGNTLRRHGGAGGRLLRSPSNPIPKRGGRRSQSVLHSPVGKQRRANMMPSSPTTTAFNKNAAVYSPGYKRKRSSSALGRKLQHGVKVKQQHHTSSSSDSDSSVSDSESDSGSSSSGSSPPPARQRTPPKRARGYDKSVGNERKVMKRAEPAKKRSPISIEIKKPAAVGVSALSGLSPAHATNAPEVKETKKSRREELLKQLRAVEDAIAKKRSKLS